MINASELGRYHYCSVSWFLSRCGFKSESASLEQGKKKHIILGDEIDKVEKQKSRSNLVSYVGYILLLLSLFFVVLEVVL